MIPVNRSGHKFNAIAQGSFQQNTIQGQYLVPGKNPVNDSWSFNGGLTNLMYSAGQSNSVLFGVGQQHVVTNFQRTLSLNGLNERYNYSGFTTTEESLFFPKAAFNWNNVTNKLFSPSGYNVSLTGLVANKALLSQVNLAQATLDAKAAITIEQIRTRFFFHGIQGLTRVSDIYQVPLSLAQLLGGAENLKAYSYNSIGPGRTMSYAGAEIQKELINKFYLVGFYDCGAVYNPTSRNTLYDAGLGLMWVSPVGPIKIEVAQAIDQNWQRMPDHSPKLVINMGPDL